MRLYLATEKWTAYIEEVKKEVADVEAVSDKVRLLQRMIDIYGKHLKLDHMVSQTWQQVLQIDPENREALDALEGQYESQSRWPDLIGVLQKKAGLVEGDAERVALLKRIAGLYVDRFSNQAEAIKTFEQVLEMVPDDGEAIEYLKQMYERRRDWEKLVDVMRREAALTEGDEQRVAALAGVARVATQHMKRSPVPAEAWRAVLELRAEDQEALDALHELYERDKSWEGLAEVLEAKVRIEEDDEAQVVLLQQLGHVYGDRLKDATLAIDVWRRVLSLAP